jgi:hypothetical protein
MITYLPLSSRVLILNYYQYFTKVDGILENMTHPEIKEKGRGKEIDLWCKLSLRKLAEPEVYHVQR